jgi:sarcosine oxidase subunit gamma
MSEPVSALQNATFDGAIEVAEAGLCGMITLRGDLSDTAFKKAVSAATGADIPAERQMVQGTDGRTVLWMSPDELLLMCPHDQAEADVAALRNGLEGQHAMVVNVSDARALFALRGAGVREVLAKGAPADLSADGLPLGEVRRSRIGQVAAAFWLTDAETAHVVCFRSVAGYMFEFLKTASGKGSLPGFL